MAYLPEPPYAHGSKARTGILLVNLGTPDEPNAGAVRRYLAEFLWDPRVVEIPRAAWWVILRIILVTRPAKSAAKYASIWTKEGSPLRVYLDRQVQLLRGYLGERVKSPLAVAGACRYGNPSVAAGIAELRGKGCDRILVLPLYPQYAASTTGSAMDAVGAVLARTRNVPAIRFVRHFHDHPAYVKAVARSVNDYWMKHGRPDRLVMSFHGLPRFSLDRGDPYHCECHKSARLIATELGWQGHRSRRRDLPRVRGRLPRDARGDRDGMPRRLPRGRRQGVQLHPHDQRLAGVHGGPHPHRARQPARLGERGVGLNRGRGRGARVGRARARPRREQLAKGTTWAHSCCVGS
jgi:ferrochelatase